MVTERMNGNISLWGKVMKVGNKMFMSGNKTTTIKLRDMHLKETKDLYGRLMILAKSNRDIDQKGAIGNHEFTLTPRSLFSPDGSMLRWKDKSKLIRLLEMLGKEAKLEQGRLPSEETGCVYEGLMDEDATQVLPTESQDVERGIAVVDGMVILYKMQSSALGTVTVVDLSHSFNDLLLSLTRNYPSSPPYIRATMRFCACMENLFCDLANRAITNTEIIGQFLQDFILCHPRGLLRF